MSEASQTKICAKCRAEKSVAEFGVLRSSEDGYNPLCFECKRKRDKESRAKKGEKAKTPKGKSRHGRPRIDKPPKEKITTARHEEPVETQLIRAIKKAAIKAFIRDELIPMMEKAVEEKFA